MGTDIFSPDKKWMWTGDEWIPAPPSSNPTANTSEVKLQDSVISGDVTVSSTTIVESVDAKVVEAAITGAKSIVSNIGREDGILHGWESASFSGNEEIFHQHSITGAGLRTQVKKLIESGGAISIWIPISYFDGTYKGVLTNQQFSRHQPCLSFEFGGNPGDYIVNVSNNLPGTIVEYSAVSLDAQIEKDLVLPLIDGLLAKEYSQFKSIWWTKFEGGGNPRCPYGEFSSLKKLYRVERNAIWWKDNNHEYAEQPNWITLLSLIIMLGSVYFAYWVYTTLSNPF